MDQPDSPKLTPNRQFDHIFVIVRADLFYKVDDINSVDFKNYISVSKAFFNEAAAQREVDRLNELNADKRCTYFYLLGRLERDPTTSEDPQNQ